MLIDYDRSVGVSAINSCLTETIGMETSISIQTKQKWREMNFEKKKKKKKIEK